MLTELYTLKNRFQDEKIFGLAVDIDETLSFTLKHWFTVLPKLFGNPENLTPDELMHKYRYFANVPYWQCQEAYEYITKMILDNDLQKTFDVIADSDIYLPKIHKEYPVIVYLTNRPVEVMSGTKAWLKMHGFPEAEIIGRAQFIDRLQGHNWKSQVLEFLSPNVTGLIDDNYEVLKYLSPVYPGDLFFYDLKQLPEGYENKDNKLKIHFCPKWSDVEREVANTY